MRGYVCSLHSSPAHTSFSWTFSALLHAVLYSAGTQGSPSRESGSLRAQGAKYPAAKELGTMLLYASLCSPSWPGCPVRGFP